MNQQGENDGKFTNENFSVRFSRLVDESTLSQKQLASALGVAESAIVNYKSGRIPRAPELLRIARFFDVSMEFLLTGFDPAADELILAGNSREAAGGVTSSGMFSEEHEESLIKRISIASPAEVLAQCAFVEETIQSLRREAEVLSEFATNLLIEAERLETLLQSMRTAYNAVARSNTEAVREYERRHGNDDVDPN